MTTQTADAFFQVAIVGLMGVATAILARAQNVQNTTAQTLDKFLLAVNEFRDEVRDLRAEVRELREFNNAQGGD